MRVAVVSGKGGAGKTTVAVNLAVTASRRGIDTSIIDCDVDAPDVDVFIPVSWRTEKFVTVDIPEADTSLCTVCGYCSSICNYNAISCLEKVVVHKDLCHSCLACINFCPQKALKAVPYEVGRVLSGNFDSLEVITGKIKVSSPLSPPVIRAAKNYSAQRTLEIIDSPPGASCPAVAATQACDAILFVIEATPFGLHDFIKVADIAREENPCLLALLNKTKGTEDEALRLCEERGITVVASLPFDRQTAELCASGELLIDHKQDCVDVFESVLSHLVEMG